MASFQFIPIPAAPTPTPTIRPRRRCATTPVPPTAVKLKPTETRLRPSNSPHGCEHMLTATLRRDMPWSTPTEHPRDYTPALRLQERAHLCQVPLSFPAMTPKPQQHSSLESRLGDHVRVFFFVTKDRSSARRSRSLAHVAPPLTPPTPTPRVATTPPPHHHSSHVPQPWHPNETRD